MDNNLSCINTSILNKIETPGLARYAEAITNKQGVCEASKKDIFMRTLDEVIKYIHRCGYALPKMNKFSSLFFVAKSLC